MSKESLEVILAVCRVLSHCGLRIEKGLDRVSAEEAAKHVAEHFQQSRKLENSLSNKVEHRIYSLNNQTGAHEHGTTKKAN